MADQTVTTIRHLIEENDGDYIVTALDGGGLVCRTEVIGAQRARVIARAKVRVGRRIEGPLQFVEADLTTDDDEGDQ